MKILQIFLCAWFPLAAIAGNGSGGAKDSLAMEYAGYVNADDLSKHLHVLASDEYEGRETGEPGQKKAAEYIQNHFEELGFGPAVEGEYYQHFPLIKWFPEGVKVSAGEREFTLFDDFYYFFKDTNHRTLNLSQIAFRGFGIDTTAWSDYKGGEDLTGKAVMVLSGEPYDNTGLSMISKMSKPSSWYFQVQKKMKAAMARGAEALLVVNDNYDRNMVRLRRYINRPSLSLATDLRADEQIPVIYISRTMAQELLGKKNKLAKLRKKMIKKKATIAAASPTGIELVCNRRFEHVVSENVLGYLEGSDKKEELLVITAHYDHIGVQKGEINNGADDDGSGTVTVLELAEAFTKAKSEGNGPRRSILFMTVAGEEKGLLGSRYYSENPVYPLENTIADLNIDMIGRVDEKHEDDPNYIYIIGSNRLSTELHDINESANKHYTGLDLDYTYNAEDDPERFYYRSDHYNFAKNNIPVIFYFSGVHKDYHKPTDTVEKINFDKMETIGRLVFYTAWELANRDQRITVDVTDEK